MPLLFIDHGSKNDTELRDLPELTSLYSVVKTLPPSTGALDLILDWGAMTHYASGPKNQNTKQKQYCNKFTKDFKNGVYRKKILGKKKGDTEPRAGVRVCVKRAPSWSFGVIESG